MTDRTDQQPVHASRGGPDDGAHGVCGSEVAAVAVGPAADRLDRNADGITDRVVASLRAGVHLRLVALAWMFELSPFDVDVVVACLAPEIDGRYERIYGYLHDDPARCAPIVGLIMDVLCPTSTRGCPPASGSARRHRCCAAGSSCSTIHRTAVRPRCSAAPRASTSASPGSFWSTPPPRMPCVGWPGCPSRPAASTSWYCRPGAGARLAALAAEPDVDLVLYLRGGPGVGKRTAAAALCAAWGAALLVVDGAQLAARPPAEFEDLLARLEIATVQARIE